MTPAENHTHTPATFTRREMLKLSILGSGALLFPLQRVGQTRGRIHRLRESRLPEPFKLPFVVPEPAEPVHKTATTDY